MVIPHFVAMMILSPKTILPSFLFLPSRLLHNAMIRGPYQPTKPFDSQHLHRHSCFLVDNGDGGGFDYGIVHGIKNPWRYGVDLPQDRDSCHSILRVLVRIHAYDCVKWRCNIHICWMPNLPVHHHCQTNTTRTIPRPAGTNLTIRMRQCGTRN